MKGINMPLTSVPVHAFAECQAIWTELSPAEQEEVLRLSNALDEAESHKAGTPRSTSVTRQLEERGIIVADNRGWRFALPQLMVFAQSNHVILSASLHDAPAERIVQTMLTLTDVEHEGTGAHQRGMADFVLANLVNAYQRADIIKSIFLQEDSRSGFWRLYDALRNTLPVLDLSVDDFIAFFHDTALQTRNDLAGPMMSSQVEVLSTFRPKLALQIIDEMSARNNRDAINYLERLITGVALLSDEFYGGIISRCLLWLNPQVPNLPEVALYCLYSLVQKGKQEPSWLLSHIEPLFGTVNKAPELCQALAVVVSGLGARHSGVSDACIKHLQQLKAGEHSEYVVHGVVSGLNSTRDAAGFAFKAACMPLFADVPTSNKGTIKEIDHFLFPFSNTHPNVVWRFLELWIENHAEGEAVVSHNMFLTPIHYAYNYNAELACITLSRWFSSVNLRLVEESRAILRELNIQELSARVIAELDTRLTKYITEKVIAGYFDGPQMFDLFYSIVRTSPHVEHLSGYFSKVLWYLAWSFPGAAQRFFRRVLEKKVRRKKLSPLESLLHEVHARLEQYHEQRKDSILPELEPSKRRVQRYIEFSSKQMRRAEEASRSDDRFPLQRILPHVAVGRGNRTFFIDWTFAKSLGG